MSGVLVLALLASLASVQARPAGVTELKLSAPKPGLEIDAGKLKGEPLRLSWGPDGSLYLRMAEIDRFGNERGRHYVIAAAGGPPAQVEQEPPWAQTYWLWKSSTMAPGLPSLKLEIESREQIKTATGTVRDDGASQTRSDPTRSNVAADAAQAQRVGTITLKLKGQLVGEFVNKPLIPGQTFGWAPAPMGVLAYADAKRRLVLIDAEGRRQDVAGTSDVVLPAWSPDGRRLVYLQQTGRRKYVLTTVEVGR